jgi:hypothetical protein
LEDDMKKLFLATAVAGMALAGLSSAEAAQGCGPGWHRGYYGHCRPNVAPAYGYGPVVIGTYYPHRGWWDGRRYWAHRDHWHGGWRYR